LFINPINTNSKTPIAKHQSQNTNRKTPIAKHQSQNTNRKTPIAKHHSTEVLFADHDNPYYLRKNTSIISDFSELTLFS